MVEAQFIVGMENETAETLEETYRMAQEWKPDLANWSMYTPWPFSKLYQDMSDKVEVFDFEKYNFVTPIMKPAAMERGELLDRVMNNYRRFYFQKALFSYPWAGSGMRRRYLLGCLNAFLKAGFQRKFYDLGKVGYWGPQSRKKVDFHFDKERAIAPAQMSDWEANADRSRKAKGLADIKACGGGDEQMADEDDFDKERIGTAPTCLADVKACGGGDEQMADDDAVGAPSTFDDRADEARSHARDAGRVGPNAAIQLLRVLPLAADAETVRRIVETAGVEDWAVQAPDGYDRERPAAALHSGDALDSSSRRPRLRSWPRLDRGPANTFWRIAFRCGRERP